MENTSMIAPMARIVLRYIAGALVAIGFVTETGAEELATNPDLLMLVGVAIGTTTEGFYAAARKWGWAK